MRRIGARTVERITRASLVALVAGRAGHRARALARTGLTRVGLGALVAVVTRGAVLFGRVRALAGRAIAATRRVTLVEGRARHRFCTRAYASLASVGLGTQRAVVAGRPVGLGGVGASAGPRVAAARAMALVTRGAGHRASAGAHPALTSIGFRARVGVVASGAVRLRRIRAQAAGSCRKCQPNGIGRSRHRLRRSRQCRPRPGTSRSWYRRCRRYTCCR